jgi:hypothetical protein
MRENTVAKLKSELAAEIGSFVSVINVRDVVERDVRLGKPVMAVGGAGVRGIDATDTVGCGFAVGCVGGATTGDGVGFDGKPVIAVGGGAAVPLKYGLQPNTLKSRSASRVALARRTCRVERRVWNALRALWVRAVVDVSWRNSVLRLVFEMK